MFILKQLRRKKNVNQKDLANAIGVSLRTVQLYEKKDANIPFKNLTKIARYFDVSIADLFSQEHVNETGINYDLTERKEKKQTILKLAPGKYLLSAPLVLTEHLSMFPKQFDDKEFMHSLQRIVFMVDRVSVSQYIAFEISNTSMENGTVQSIPFKSVVLGKEVPLKKINHHMRNTPNTPAIIVCRGNVMCRIISDYDKKEKTLWCKSLNNSPEYLDFRMKLEEIEQFYTVVAKQMGHV